MTLPIDYPLNPPQFRFLTKIYSPIVGSKGEICCCKIGTCNEWSPALTIQNIVNMIKKVIFYEQYGYEKDFLISP